MYINFTCITINQSDHQSREFTIHIWFIHKIGRRQQDVSLISIHDAWWNYYWKINRKYRNLYWKRLNRKGLLGCEIWWKIREDWSWMNWIFIDYPHNITQNVPSSRILIREREPEREREMEPHTICLLAWCCIEWWHILIKRQKKRRKQMQSMSWILNVVDETKLAHHIMWTIERMVECRWSGSLAEKNDYYF